MATRRLVISLDAETDRVLREAAAFTGASEAELCRRAIRAGLQTPKERRKLAAEEFNALKPRERLRAQREGKV